MNIRTSSIVFALSIITLGGVVYSQSASIGAVGKGAFPLESLAASYERLANSNVSGLDRKVTKKFENSTIEEILSALSNEKLAFVADLGDLKSARVSISLDEVPLGDALDNLADLFDGHWERNGGVFMLKAGNSNVSASRTAIAPDATELPQSGRLALPNTGIEDKADILDRIEIRSKDGKTQAYRYDSKQKRMVPMDLKTLEKLAPQFKYDFKSIPMFEMSRVAPHFFSDGQRAYRIDPKTGKQVPLTKEERAKLEKEWQAWGEKYGKEWEKWGEEFGKHWEKWGKDFEKQMKDGKGGVFVMPKVPGVPSPKVFAPNAPGSYYFYKDGQGKELTPEQKKEIEQHMKAVEKSLNEMKVFDERAMKELHEKMQKLHGEGKVRMTDPKALKELENLKLDGKVRMLDEKAMKELHEKMQKLHGEGRVRMMDPKALKELPMAPRAPMVLTAERIGKLLDSLTNEQKAKHKENGHLKWSDLTPAQREILGVKSEGSFTISFTVGDRSITIKND